jgi:hypothetical protein
MPAIRYRVHETRGERTKILAEGVLKRFSLFRNRLTRYLCVDGEISIKCDGRRGTGMNAVADLRPPPAFVAISRVEVSITLTALLACFASSHLMFHADRPEPNRRSTLSTSCKLPTASALSQPFSISFDDLICI